MREFFSGIDIVVTVFLFFFIYLFVRKVQETNIERYSYYSHYTRALFIRLFFGVCFACVYIFYYDGGDTQYYFTGARSIVRMATKNVGAFFRLMIGERTPELLSLFDYSTGWPTYFKDANSWAVCRFSVPFYVLGCGTYLGMTTVMNFVLFFPLWRFYRMIVKLYPKCSDYFAFALFYIPSVCFWGSGLLKDIWCVVGVFSIYTSCWMIFIRKKKIVINSIIYLFWAYVLTSIRPYTFYTVFATSIVWIGLHWLKKFDSRFIRVAFFPFMAVVIAGIFIVFMDNVSDLAEGKYATVGSMMEQAVIIQDDLKRDYYGSNSFDIGAFDATIPGMLKKLPQALMAGLYRPYIWEARTPFMLLSGIENILILLMTFWALIKVRFGLFSLLARDNFLLSILVFVLAFGFFIGLTIANFGALVRYRIILLPFFVVILLRLWYLNKQQKLQEDQD
ncbi:MAG: hypothetical protein MJ198_02645 [Bacteroidales bacterium]|nr:hypothetical protein [Bacteroidales bacterium]